jgi:hypothetical protein
VIGIDYSFASLISFVARFAHSSCKDPLES